MNQAPVFTPRAAAEETPPAALKAAVRPVGKAPWQVWRDAAGRLSLLRLFTLAALFAPVVIAVHAFATAGFGARPLNDLIHRAGYWALVFLLVAVAITPLRRIARFNQLADVRRMIGVGAFIYIAAHLSLYVADQMFDLWKVAAEIAKRFYLTIGFVALLGLATLAATSTDGWVRRLGAKRWQKLHSIVYGVGLLALIHFFQQTKADVWVPTFVAGLFGWMMGYRLLIKLRKSRDEPPTWMLLLLSAVVSILTFLGEAIGIGIVFHVSPLVVLSMAFDFDIYSIRPGWLVLGAGLIAVAVDFVRARFGQRHRMRSVARPSKA